MIEENGSRSSKSLSAIMFTDIVGFSTMMGEDEKATMNLVRENVAIQKPIVEKYGGRWLKEMGDGSMSSFSTASEAIYAAKEIQKSAGNVSNLSLRIGIHIGEVINEGGDIYGDGVNIASRIESQAAPGGICISEAVRNSVSGITDIDSILIGEAELKNVQRPVKIYAVTGDELNVPEQIGSESGGKKKLLLWLTSMIVVIPLVAFLIYQSISGESNYIPDDSTIAVFPFQVQGNDDLKYLEEGMVDLISSKLNGLYRFRTVDPHMIVASTNSSEIGEKNPSELYEMAQSFGAGQFVLGSIIQLGNSYRLKISIYGSDESSTESEVVIKNEDELLSGIDELIRKTISNQLIIEGLETEGLAMYSTDDYQAIKAFLEGESLRRRGKYNDAMKSYEEAIEIDSTMSMAWLRLSQACSWITECVSTNMHGYLSKAGRYKGSLPEQLRDFVSATESRLYFDMTSDEKFESLISKYGEKVDYLIGLSEALFHDNENKGRMPSEALPYLLKAREYDKENTEILNHLVTLLAYEGDSKRLREVIEKVGYDSYHGYIFKGLELITSDDPWSDEDLQFILDHPDFNFQDLFNGCLIEPYLNRLIELKVNLERVRGEEFADIPDQPYSAIIRIWQGREEEAARSFAGNPFTNYLMPITNLQEGLSYLEEYEDGFKQPKEGDLFPLPYEIVMAVRSLGSGDMNSYQNYVKSIREDQRFDDITRSYFLKFLDGSMERTRGNYEISLQKLQDALLTGPIVVDLLGRRFINGTMKFLIAENYFDLGNYEQALHWYNVRLSVLNAGDELVVGYSYLRRAQIYEKLEEPEQAVEYYERFLELYENSDPKYSEWMKTAEESRQRLLTENI